jgi:hypothetical protein
MKSVKILLLSFFVLLAILSVAQTSFEPYFLYLKDSKVKIGHYNRRSIPQGFTVFTVIDYTDTDTIDYYTIKVETLDRYQRPINEETFDASFFEGEVVVEKLFLMNIDTLTLIDEASYLIEGRDYVIPAFLGNGIALSSTWVELIKDEKTVYKISEFSRVVDSFEKIKTAAGEFDACIISSKLEMNYGETTLLSVYAYYTRGIGPVRINYYNTKRKLVRYSEIVEYSIPGKS